MLYGAECWLVKNSHVYKMKIMKMMLRWIYGHTRRDNIRNEDTQDKVGVALKEDKMQKMRLK